MSRGIGFGGFLGIGSILIVAVIAAILFLKDAETSVEAKQSADRTLEEVREIMKEQSSMHQRAIEEARGGLDLPDRYPR